LVARKSDFSVVKKALFYVVMLLFVIIMLELFVYGFLKIILNGYSISSLIETRNNFVEGNITSIVNSPSLEVLHPYLGFVFDPTKNTKGLISHQGGFSILDYGFIDNHTPFYKENEDSIVIGIFGGSVAYYFSVFGVDSLLRQLDASSLFRNKEIKIVRVALGGYKQPQQLMSLTYLLSLGAHFDVVINLDGFNEVALPVAENIPNKIAPFFPRNWYGLSSPLMSYETKILVGELGYLRAIRNKFASLVNNSVLRFSNIMNLIWLVSDKYLATAISVKQEQLSFSTAQQVASYQQTGPKYTYRDNLTLYRDLASYWSMSSQQMARLCQANEILYWHFLQPNQYVQGSKTLSEEERKIAFNPEMIYKDPAEQGYPALIEAGHELANSNLSNMQFHDLTGIFKSHPESVYRDDCCHLNEHGNEILGDTIGKLMVEDIARRASFPQAPERPAANVPAQSRRATTPR
jgi:hypothetical protein